MHVLSVNIGKVEAIANAKPSGTTGIYKCAVTTATTVTAQGLVGDAICDTENHGGVDQAVYIYGAPDYAWWGNMLGGEMVAGTFGENITISDLESAQLHVGDRLHMGSVTLEITAPRVPCITLARRMNDPAFLKLFRAAERPGAYCRVVQEGTVQIDNRVEYEPYDGVRVGIIELFCDFFTSQHNEATVRRHLAAPIAMRARRDKEKQLEQLLR